MKTKYAAGAPRISTAMADTSRTPVGAKLPPVAPLPTAADNRSYMYETPDANMPNPQDSQSLAMFNASAGYSDSGASSTGDKGGAA